MGIVINPRGASGAGKTSLARQILADYGWKTNGDVAALYFDGRVRPIAYRLGHPLRRRPLVVLGHYERTSGGCDTIRLTDGGVGRAFRLAAEFAGSGHDVLLEGSDLSSEHLRSVAFAATHQFHILHLTTPLERCVSNLVARRRMGKDASMLLRNRLEVQMTTIEAACHRLQCCAAVEQLDFDGALERARHLLGLMPAAREPRDG